MSSKHCKGPERCQSKRRSSGFRSGGNGAGGGFSHLNRILDYYRNKGYSTALDDIGSGYANIEALLKLKPDYMKIDMDIVRDIHTDLENQRKLDAFILNGKKIGLTILAEGVETQDEFEFLKQKGVDLFQGYLFGRPEEVPRKI